MRTRQECVATDTQRSPGCLTTPLEHWSKRKPTVEPRPTSRSSLAWYDIESWSIGDVLPEKPGQHDDIWHRIQISRRFYNRRIGSACRYKIVVSDLHEMLYQKNQTSMSLYYTGSWSAGDLLPEEPGQHDIIQYYILINRRWFTGSISCYKTCIWSTGDVKPEKRISMMLYNTGSWSAGGILAQHDGIWHYFWWTGDILQVEPGHHHAI